MGKERKGKERKGKERGKRHRDQHGVRCRRNKMCFQSSNHVQSIGEKSIGKISGRIDQKATMEWLEFINDGWKAIPSRCSVGKIEAFRPSNHQEIVFRIAMHRFK